MPNLIPTLGSNIVGRRKDRAVARTVSRLETVEQIEARSVVAADCNRLGRLVEAEAVS